MVSLNESEFLVVFLSVCILGIFIMICVSACLEHTRRGRRIIEWCNKPHATSDQDMEPVVVNVYNPVVLERDMIPTAPPNTPVIPLVRIAPPPNLAMPTAPYGAPYGAKVES